jgi:hypothetical protein
MGDLQRDRGGAGAPWRRVGRVRAAALLGLAGVLVACGGRAPDAKSPGPDPAGNASQEPAGSGKADPGRDPSRGPAQDPARAPAEQPAGPDTNGARPAGAVTEADCQALLAHVVAVANAAHVRTVAPEHAPTPEQLAEIRARMAPEFVPACLSLDRATLACQMRAGTQDELLACMPP